MDTKYIDANKFKRVYESFNIKYKNSEAVVMIPVKSIIQSIENAEAADVVPARHGKWINGICSECGAGVYEDYYRRDILTSYCPDCGARMDGKDNSNENRNDEG